MHADPFPFHVNASLPGNRQLAVTVFSQNRGWLEPGVASRPARAGGWDTLASSGVTKFTLVAEKGVRLRRKGSAAEKGVSAYLRSYGV